MKLVVIIPALNEEPTIARVVSNIPTDIPGVEEVEVVVMNDGSTDNTAREAADAGARVVNLPGKQGLGVVFKRGMETAMKLGADIIVNIDGDGQFDSGDVPRLIKPILENEADFVTCTRFGDPELRPEMPWVKRWGNSAVTGMINWICGNTSFTDVSCGFRAFNREAAYRLTLFGKYTYTQETFIDLFSKGLRMTEVPLKVRGVREHGKSRVCRSIWKYATNSFPIMLRAMRDVHPLSFFGKIAAFFGLLGVSVLGFVSVWYFMYSKTSPFTSLIVISGLLITTAILMFVLAMMADMVARHRRISEEMLYLARRRVYANARSEAELADRPAHIEIDISGNGESEPDKEEVSSADLWTPSTLRRSSDAE